MIATTVEKKIFLTIPLMDEMENIPQLLAYLHAQTYTNFKVIICVNQPEAWWEDPQKRSVCNANRETLSYLQGYTSLDLQVIDRSSPGKGWTGKHFGVGWARKVAMEEASSQAQEDDLIMTMDGDTEYPANLLSTVADAFEANPGIKALSIPYFHKLTQRAQEDVAILRYEIYMRYYSLNMLRIQNPYAFTALGSAIACTVQAFRGIRGMTPHKSGEDFYFLQKLRKYGSVLIHCSETIFPAARFSDRVFFGTGPAMIRGNGGDWSGYPIYPYQFFDEVKDTFDSFEKLYDRDLGTPMTAFLYEKFGENFWQALRENVKSRPNFIRACQHKVDGLRILQFLKWRHGQQVHQDEESLLIFVQKFYPDSLSDLKDLSFENLTVASLDKIRHFFKNNENQWQEKLRILR